MRLSLFEAGGSHRLLEFALKYSSSFGDNFGEFVLRKSLGLSGGFLLASPVLQNRNNRTIEEDMLQTPTRLRMGRSISSAHRPPWQSP